MILQDYKDENTPLHTVINESCDKDLIEIILEGAYKFGKKEGPSPTTVPNRQGNTALHLSCGRNTLGLAEQKEVIGLLLKHGAMIQLKNINGCVPSVLVDSSRKQVRDLFRSFMLPLVNPFLLFIQVLFILFYFQEIKSILHSYRLKQS